MRLRNNNRGGALIAMALFFAAVGILMGLGRLKSYEYQVARRADRTYQIEKKLAARSIITAIDYSGGGRAQKNLVRFYPVFSNEYASVNSGERFFCVAEPTKYLELQYNFTSNNWHGFPNISIRPPAPATLGIRSIESNNVEYIQFKVDQPETNKVYRGAIFCNTLDSWLNNERGYLYQLYAKETAFPCKTRMYVVGSDATTTFSSGHDYASQLTTLPWIMLELEKTITEEGNKTTLNLHIRGKASGEIFSEYHDTAIEFSRFPGNVSELHPFGILLSKNYLVAYTSNADANLFFSKQRYNLSEVVNTNDFSNVWVLIEQEFDPISEESQRQGFIIQNVNAFFIKEPTTHSIAVLNKKITEPDMFAQQLMTWMFQIELPIQAGHPGRHCLLDTFGGEPTSLKKERRGELKR